VEQEPTSAASLTPPSDADLPARIGGYRVVRRLATGGTSDVLLATAEGPHGFARAVVLKLLLPQYRQDDKIERMFAREAAAYARLSHPAIVKLFDFFSDSGQLVMVLEYVDGLALHKLRALIKAGGGGLDDRAAMFVASRVFGALSAAHAARDPQTGEFAPVIHRDVNPSNVLIPWDGHAKIADFGIAKIAGVDNERTQAGFIKGTYGYMAPEQARGEAVSVGTDIYAACLLIWELLAGRKAIVRGRSSDLEVLRAMAEPAFPPLGALRPDLPRGLLDAVALGLQADPERRTIHAEEMVQVLRAATDLEEGRRRLVDALAGVRPPSTADELATTLSRPIVRVSGSADETIPNPVTLRGVSTSEEPDSAKSVELSVVGRPPPPPMQVPRAAGPPRAGTVTLSGSPIAPPVAPTPKPPSVPPPPRPAPLVKTLSAHPPPPAPVATTARMQQLPATPLPPRPPAPPSPPPPAIAQVLTARTPPPGPAAWSPAPPPPPPVAWVPAPPVPPPHFVPVVVHEPIGRPQGRRGGIVALVLALIACAGAAVVLWSRSRPTAYSPPAKATFATAAASTPASAPTSASARAAATASAPATAPTYVPTLTAASATQTTTGTVTVPASRAGHRVWIDDHIVGESPGTFTVRCGWHTVRVGSQGSVLNLNVPCGGDVATR